MGPANGATPFHWARPHQCGGMLTQSLARINSASTSERKAGLPNHAGHSGKGLGGPFAFPAFRFPPVAI